MKKTAKVSVKEIKSKKIEELSEKIGKAKSIVFADYRGLTAAQMSELRNKVKEARGELIISKNTLTKKALSNHQLITTDELAGPSAAILAYADEVAPIKAASEIAKTLHLPTFKFGFFAKKKLTASQIEELSALPSRGILQATVVNAIASPLYGLVSILQANIRNLIYVLDQAAKKA